MNLALAYLNDRTDPRVIEALEKRCGICKAKPHNDCRLPWETREKLDRIVHLERTQQELDKRKRKSVA